WVLNGHCNSPIAGFAEVKGDQISLAASVLDHAGHRIIEASRSGPADRPRELGRAVGLDLLAKGAAEIIERSRPVGSRRFVGWVERSETHHDAGGSADDGFRFALPILHDDCQS